MIQHWVWTTDKCITTYTADLSIDMESCIYANCVYGHWITSRLHTLVTLAIL